MQCNLTQCEWNGCDACCVDNEAEHSMAKPNDISCPSFYDLKTAAAEEREEYIIVLMEAVNAMDLSNADKIEQGLRQMNIADLITKGYNMINDLWELHHRNKLLDSMIVEVALIGPEKFKEKYLTV